MIEPNETSARKHLLSREVIAHTVVPVPVPHGGPIRKGHSNGLRVHAILFGTISLAVIVVLAVGFALIAGTRM